MAVWQPDPRYQEPPSALRDLVDVVLGDLQVSEPIPVLVGWDPNYVSPGSVVLGCEDPATPYLMFSEPGPWGGVGWTPAAPGAGGEDREWGDEFTPAELAVGLADYLQEQFFPESWAAWGQAHPLCPGHSHPAEPRLIDGDAWWTCPLDGHGIARFGVLGNTDLG